MTGAGWVFSIFVPPSLAVLTVKEKGTVPQETSGTAELAQLSTETGPRGPTTGNRVGAKAITSCPGSGNTHW